MEPTGVQSRHLTVEERPRDRSASLHIRPPSAPWKGRDEIAAAHVGTDEELDRLYREHADRLWRAVLAFAGDGEVASDAVAEAFAQCLRRGAVVRDPARWIWRAAFRIAAGELKDRRRRQDMSVRAEDPYVIPDAAAEILELLMRLSPRQRAAVVLHDYVGYSTEEVASILGATAATVRVHLSQGRRRLRAFLEAGDA
jgi:RNA polymerase sigma factor (sigma-70 family)